MRDDYCYKVCPFPNSSNESAGFCGSFADLVSRQHLRTMAMFGRKGRKAGRPVSAPGGS